MTAALSLFGELNETLRDAGARRGVYIGSQFKGATIRTDDAYRQKHSQEFSLSTVGNMCKWRSTHPTQDSFTLDKCNDAFAYARSANQKFRVPTQWLKPVTSSSGAHLVLGSSLLWTGPQPVLGQRQSVVADGRQFL